MVPVPHRGMGAEARMGAGARTAEAVPPCVLKMRTTDGIIIIITTAAHTVAAAGTAITLAVGRMTTMMIGGVTGGDMMIMRMSEEISRQHMGCHF